MYAYLSVHVCLSLSFHVKIRRLVDNRNIMYEYGPSFCRSDEDDDDDGVLKQKG